MTPGDLRIALERAIDSSDSPRGERSNDSVARILERGFWSSPRLAASASLHSFRFSVGLRRSGQGARRGK